MSINAEKLEKMLLAFGGNTAYIDNSDPDFDNYFLRGLFIDRPSDIIVQGEMCQCHKNSIMLWKTHKKKYKMMTGYALSEKGTWHQHSWLIDENNRIIETTEKRVKYFGYVLNSLESETFLITYTQNEDC